MNQRYLYLFIILFGMVVIGCESDFIEGVRVDGPVKDTGSVITMVTKRTDGIISLSIDAPAHDRFGVWIDLDGDGKRAEDGSEKITVFNAYQEYTLVAGVKTVAVHGDISYLGAASNELAEIDVSGNPSLTTLNIALNKIRVIDLSANTTLERLDVSDNNIASLNVSSNKSLESLWVFNNQLSSLELSNNSNLAFLDCSGNALNTLDVSKNAELVRLLCYNNQLTALDVERNIKLNHLWSFGNPMSETEMESLISTLRNVAGGELWLSIEPLGEAMHASAAEKGWTVQ